MKKIVILGCSAASVKIIEDIRAKDTSREIMLIAFDGYYPYKRDTFAPFIAQEIPLTNVFCRDKKFYEHHDVNVILDQKISRINIKRKIIFTEDKNQIEYDVLIVTDTPENRFPPIRGANKTGVFGYKKLRDIDRMVNDLPLRDTITIQSNSFSGLCAATAFVKRKKEVLLVSSQADFLGKHFENDVLQWLVNQFDQAGLRMIRDNTISEILGDKDVKAIRLKSGKVLSTQVLIFVETDEDLRLFLDSGLQMDTTINVNDQFQTNVEGIFAIDQVSSKNNSEPTVPFPTLEAQGAVVAAAIEGEGHAMKISTSLLELDVAGLTITVLGQTEITADRAVHRTFDSESKKYQGLYLENNCLIGAVLINANDKRDEFLHRIRNKERFEPSSEICSVGGENTGGENVDGAVSQDISTELVDN